MGVMQREQSGRHKKIEKNNFYDLNKIMKVKKIKRKIN